MCVTIVIYVIMLKKTAIVGVILLVSRRHCTCMAHIVHLVYVFSHCLPEGLPLVQDVNLRAFSLGYCPGTGTIIIDWHSV